MKAITIIQPWATLIALGEKNFETRGWATKYRGPLAIHAGKKVDREACEMEPIKSTLAEYGYTADELPTGAVVAIAELTECWSVSRCLRGDIILERDGGNEMREDSIGKREEAFGYYDDGRYAWELTDVKQLPVPIPAKGQQGLWNWQPLQEWKMGGAES
ncbi:ASCH domain-containing protein [Paenibacillus thiaminolyticus]|uniref:ASCH domain-containing protein n=1 Tax=Paenibacillus thiaminolyticus TaxID=49283 RepID=UPI0013F59E91|nr:ASCH domain-containing protein [Paenibacillus thiaminolyticus]NGP60081.1 ASCH domain-containing protein [Paenibacillus thiaminolyticus]